MMSMGCPEAEDNKPIQLENRAITAVDNFTYFSSYTMKLSVKLVQGWERLQETICMFTV